MSLPVNFWSKTAPADCTIWTGAVNSKGYGCFSVGGQSQLAHRLAWEDAHGPIPEGMTVDHLCRVRNCVKVAHLELVTVAENSKRARDAAGYYLGGQCGQGHDLTAETTHLSPRGRLICRRCAAEHTRASVARRELSEGKVPAHLIREWALANGIPVATRGRLSPQVRRAYMDAHAARAA